MPIRTRRPLDVSGGARPAARHTPSVGSGADEALTVVEAYRRAPEAFRRIITWGKLKAHQQRANHALPGILTQRCESAGKRSSAVNDRAPRKPTA